MNELTKLQRIGISTLLINFRYHGNQWFRSGTITFTYNALARFYNMFVKCNEREINIRLTLSEEENIDVGVHYKCSYMDEEDMFKIITLDERGYEC